MKKQLTDALCRGAEFRGKNYLIWDAEATGLGLRVWDKGKGFIFQTKLHGRTRSKALGRVGEIKLSQARDRIREMRGRIAMGEDPFNDIAVSKGKWTLRDGLNYFLSDYANQKDLSSKYKADCASLGKNWISSKWMNRKIDTFTKEEIVKKHRSMEQIPRRANLLLSLLSKIFVLAIEKGHRPDNPVTGIKRFEETKRDKYLSDREMKNLWKYLRKDKYQSAASCVMFLIVTGARSTETFRAKWSDIDLEKGVWTKPASSTKQKKIHRVQLNSLALEILNRLDSQLMSEYVFPSPIDPSKPRENLKKFWNRVKRDCALPDIRIHDIRHNFGSQLAMQGVSSAAIGELMGHQNPSTTTRYIHHSPDFLTTASEKIVIKLEDDSDIDQRVQMYSKKGWQGSFKVPTNYSK